MEINKIESIITTDLNKPEEIIRKNIEDLLEKYKIQY